MSAQNDPDKPFQTARAVIRNGGFDEVKNLLGELGFCFKQGNDPNHWIYYHPELRGDPIFRYPCNLYRPHGTRRSSGRIGKHDQSKAKQMIEALRVVREASRKEDTENESDENETE